MALSETIRKGQNDSSGKEVVSNMKGKVFSGVSGNLVLDENGDREPDYWITDMDPTTGIFVKIAEVLNGDSGLKVIFCLIYMIDFCVFE